MNCYNKVLTEKKGGHPKKKNCGKPDDPISVLTSSVNQLGHVTSKGLTRVKIFREKCRV